jgi:hypothetical protein
MTEAKRVTWCPGAESNRRIAVGTPVARRPPHRSQRAPLAHWAPALSGAVEPLGGIGMIDPGEG